jgi:hypothetical protein
MSGPDFIHRIIVGGFIFVSFEALIAGTLLTFLLTSWRARLTWIDWTIALLPILPATSILMIFPSEDLLLRFVLVPASFGFAIGLPLGLFCSMWVIAVSRDPEAQN